MNKILFCIQKKVYRGQVSAYLGMRVLAFLTVLAMCNGLQAQQKKSPIQLADQYFAAGEYYTAANLYEQYLNPSKKQKTVSDFPLNVKARRGLVAADGNVSRMDIVYKQAESYRLANYWQQAANSYKKCIDEDASQYPGALYWYAVCERSLGRYDSARETLKQYLNVSADKMEFKDAASSEWETLSFIQQQVSRADSVLFKIKKLDAPNSSVKGLFAPAFVSGSEFLVTSTEPDSIQVNGINPYHSHLFYATMQNGTVATLTPVTFSNATAASNQGAASTSADGKYLYFSQWKKENGKTVSAIYFSIKQANGWSAPSLLGSVNTTGYNSKQPFCTIDGKYLFFSSDRPGGSGKFDIWYAEMKKDGTTSEPINLGSSINSNDDEQAPFYQSSSNTLVFSSNRAGMGGYDLFESKGNEATWKAPENMGYPINSSRDDIYFLAPEKTNILSNAIVGSDRGTGCCLESYTVVKTPKNKKLNGILNDCSNNAPLADASVELKDINGKTWKSKTNSEGRYSFDLGNGTYSDMTVSIGKDQYLDKTSSVTINKTDETDLLTDKLTSADLCLEKKPEPKPEKLVIRVENVVTVFFDFDKSILKSGAVEKLDSIYNVLSDDTTVNIQISGYTDGLGTDAYNKVLSDKRARACANYLIQKGIDAHRVSFVSFGACCPVEMEKINGRDNPDGRSRNRRALINIDRLQTQNGN